MNSFDKIQDDIKIVTELGAEIARLQERLLFKIDMNDKRNFDLNMADKIRERITLLQFKYFPAMQRLGLMPE